MIRILLTSSSFIIFLPKTVISPFSNAPPPSLLFLFQTNPQKSTLFSIIFSKFFKLQKPISSSVYKSFILLLLLVFQTGCRNHMY